MTIFIYKDGRTVWKFYIKSYKKARWRKLGQRMVNEIIKSGCHGLVII